MGQDDFPVRAREIFATARSNAVKRGIDWRMTDEECQRLWRRADGRCEVSGMPFELGPVAARGRRRPFAPSLDRIDSRVGYTKANTRLVTILANLALNEWGIEPVIAFARALAAQADQADAQRIDVTMRRWRATPADLRPPGWVTVAERWPDLRDVKLARKRGAARSLARRLGLPEPVVDVVVGRREDGTVLTREERVYPSAMLDELDGPHSSVDRATAS